MTSDAMNNKKSRPEYEALVDRIVSRELTRAQAAHIAAEQTGLKPQTFLSWLRTSGNLDRLKPTRGNSGTNSPFSHTDHDKVKAYADAMTLALTRKVSVRAAAAKFGVNYPYLLRKLNRIEAFRSSRVGDRTAEALRRVLGKDFAAT